MYVPPKDAVRQEAAEFWKPERKGDALVGVVESFGENNMGQHVTIAPVVLFPREGTPEGYGAISVGMNSSLRKRLGERQKGEPVAIHFAGLQKTPAGGNPMKLYEVHRLPASEWTELETKFITSTTLRESPTGEDVPVDDEHDGDDLPF